MLCIRDMESQSLSSAATTAGSSEYFNKLKTVFEVCDEKNDGYITIEHFENLIREHFGGGESEELYGIIQFLDPDGKGKINFNDFCQGVQRIISLPNQGGNSIKRNYSDVSDDEINLEKHTESSTTSTNTYAEYDINTDEDGATSSHDFFSVGVDSFDLQLPPLVTSEDDRDSFISGRSSEVTENSRHDITDEDNYEDFGEAEELESQSEADTPSHTRGHINCVKCKKARHRRDLLPRHHRRICRPNKRLSSAAYASQLQRSGTVPSRRNSLGSDELIDDIDGNFEVLNDKVRSLEKQISFLTENQMKNEDKHQRLKEENSSLIQKDIVYRVHILEEQLREMEIRSDEQVKDEVKKHKEYVKQSRQDRDKAEQLIYLSHRLQDVDRHYEASKEEAIRLKTEVEKLKAEKLELHDKLSETQYSYATLLDDHEKQHNQMLTQASDFEQERQATAQLLDELGKELTDLRKYKIETEHIRKTQQKNATELPEKCRELEDEVQKLREVLRQENRNLRDSNDDLNVQLLSRCMEEGRRLLKYNGAISLADEIDHLTKEELMEALKEQQDVNERLKQYVDKIILKILEKNPSLLEINH